MELLSLLFMSSCFLTLSGLTFGDQSDSVRLVGGAIRCAEKPVIVREGGDAILPCSFSTDIEFVRFQWTKERTEKNVFICDSGQCDRPAFPHRVSLFRDELQHGNASIKINNVQLEDRGNYTCNFTTSGKTFRIELVVGAAELYVTSHDQISGRVLLQCDVKNAYPEPTVEWRDSNNETIRSEEPQVSKQGERFYITLNATVKKNDLYRCVATQKDINHQTQEEINVHLKESNTGWTGWIGWIVAVLAGVVVGILVWCCFKNKKKRNKESSEPSAQEMKLNADQSV